MGRAKKLSAEEYLERFESFMETGEPVYDSTDKELEMEEGEEWRQCFEPHDPARRDFPKFWFVSDRGNLISCERKRPKWIKWYVDKEGYYSYHFLLNGHIKNVKAHNLVGLVYGAERIGDAKKKLEDDGIYGFGTRPESVNGHHIRDIKSFPEGQNDPSNIQFLTSGLHKAIESAPKPEANTEAVERYMEKLTKEVDSEMPDEIVAVSSGEIVINGTAFNKGSVAVGTLPSLKMTKTAAGQFQEILNFINNNMA